MQAVMPHSDRGVEIVTLFTQAIWHITPSKYTYVTALVNCVIIALLAQIM
jgi:hypothetical protein